MTYDTQLLLMSHFPPIFLRTMSNLFWLKQLAMYVSLRQLQNCIAVSVVWAHCRCMQLALGRPRRHRRRRSCKPRCKQTALSWVGPVESLPSAVIKLGFFSESLRQSNKIQVLTILSDHSCGLTLLYNYCTFSDRYSCVERLGRCTGAGPPWPA